MRSAVLRRGASAGRRGPAGGGGPWGRPLRRPRRTPRQGGRARPLRRPAVRVGSAVALVVLGAGCAAGGPGPDDPPLRAAVDAPPRFDPPAGRPRLSPADTLPGGGCLSPMTDPRDGTPVRMMRSWVTRADYETPPGRYGVGEGELLRLECSTGEVVGVVRR